ncbi:MAG: NAD(P)H-dependent oxidoreductase subunit E [Clostridiaceae bacterium]|nr:NAD(P)H-dependent oxidoreductase subunit E [Clostridiaceae bacterium]
MTDMDEILQEIFTYYEKDCDMANTEKLLPLLREIQEAKGYIPESVKQMISERLALKSTYIDAVIKRYPSLKEQPYLYEIRVCTDGRCSSKGALTVLHEFEILLNVQKGQVTKDNLFYLNTCQCIHNCAKGPNVLVNDKLYSQVTPAMVNQIIRDFRP